MDATATPRGISLAVGELGARGRPTFYMTSRTAVSVNRKGVCVRPPSSWTSVLVTPTPHTACITCQELNPQVHDQTMRPFDPGRGNPLRA